MGINILLEIKPEQISKQDWEDVYDESLKLIEAYPFAMLELENIYGIKRKVLTRAKEQIGDNSGRYWRVCGDMETKRRAETFELYRSLDKYLPYRADESYEYRDILLDYIDGEYNMRVFSEKTQGEDYHLYILAVACLIESRLEGSAITFGDFDVSQAEFAVDWANSVLEKSIELPIITRYRDICERLKSGKPDSDTIGDFYLVASESEGLSEFVADYFSEIEVASYYREVIGGYESPTQLGAIRRMMDFLDLGYSIESLSNLCCLDDEGPKFEYELFVRGLCDTWVFVPEEQLDEMDMYRSKVGQVKSVGSMFGEMMMATRGLQGVNIGTHIPLEEFKASLISVFGKRDEINAIVDEEYAEIMARVEWCIKKVDDYWELQGGKEEANKADIIYAENNLAAWKPGIAILKSTENEIIDIRTAIDTLMKSRELPSMGKLIDDVIGNIEGPGKFVRLADEQGLVFSKDGWDFFENKDNELDPEIFMLLLGVATVKRDIAVALIENKELLRKYILE